MVASFSIPVPSRVALCPATKFSFLSLSFQPYTVAVSSFQPSGATPTSWLTQFCSEVTGFLANFQRVVLTPDPLSVPHAPAVALVELTASVLHTNALIQWHGW